MSLQLMCVNYGELKDACKVTKYCAGLHKFDAVTIIHPRAFDEYSEGIEMIRAQSDTQNDCWIKEVPIHAHCDHVLSIHWDGFIINPEAWSPRFLEYDWIGAPWRLQNLPNQNWRVGSGGFCMFTKRMARAWYKNCREDANFDWQIGALYRDKFEALGLKYAPLELAAKFCKECDLEDVQIDEGASFGFHGFSHAQREHYRKLVYQ